MIEQILPETAVAVEAFDDPPEGSLLPEEEAYVARAVDKRRREFTTVRLCARTAMSKLGVPPAPILPGERGAPGWPDGVVGSMTHCVGYRAAVLARTGDLASVGIDAEPHEPLPDGVRDVIALPAEQERLGVLAGQAPDVHWDRMLFSAKESVYKAWFPLARRFLDFSEAEIHLDTTGGFTARLLVPGPYLGARQITGFTGRWLVAEGLVVTAITVLP